MQRNILLCCLVQLQLALARSPYRRLSENTKHSEPTYGGTTALVPYRARDGGIPQETPDAGKQLAVPEHHSNALHRLFTAALQRAANGKSTSNAASGRAACGVLSRAGRAALLAASNIETAMTGVAVRKVSSLASRNRASLGHAATARHARRTCTELKGARNLASNQLAGNETASQPLRALKDGAGPGLGTENLVDSIFICRAPPIQRRSGHHSFGIRLLTTPIASCLDPGSPSTPSLRTTYCSQPRSALLASDPKSRRPGFWDTQLYSYGDRVGQRQVPWG